LEIRGVSREEIRVETEQNAESNLSIRVDSSSSKNNKSATKKKEKRKTKGKKIIELDEHIENLYIGHGNEQNAKSSYSIGEDSSAKSNKFAATKEKKKTKGENRRKLDEHQETVHHDLHPHFWENARAKYHGCNHRIRQEQTSSLPISEQTFLTEIDSTKSNTSKELTPKGDIESSLTKEEKSTGQRNLLLSLRSLQYLVKKLDNEDIRSRVDINGARMDKI